LTFRFCDESDDGFGWIADERLARTSHALAVDGRAWLVDAVLWPEALDRARELGEPAGVIQLLDRHARDCAVVAAELGVPHLRVPDRIDAPLELVRVVNLPFWRERALWWPERRVLVVADALGTVGYFTPGGAPLGVHPLLRPFPPRRRLGRLTPTSCSSATAKASATLRSSFGRHSGWRRWKPAPRGVRTAPTERSEQEDDAAAATNYPLVRIRHLASGRMGYCRTFGQSTMAVAIGSATVSTNFHVPSNIDDKGSEEDDEDEDAKAAKPRPRRGKKR
jgi:hypothetical protein